MQVSDTKKSVALFGWAIGYFGLNKRKRRLSAALLSSEARV